MSAVELHRSLASKLPGRLQKFFALNPPRLQSAISTHAPPTATQSAAESSPTPTSNGSERLNPFSQHKHPKTGRWHPPIYSLRRQAELVKLAQQHGVAELLPFTNKAPEERARRRAEHGLRVKGTGVGQRVKGHEWERTMKGKLEARRQAMLKMPMLIQEWKRLGHGRWWKNWPK